MKYTVVFNMVNRNSIKGKIGPIVGADLEVNCDVVADHIARTQFFHFYEDGNLVVVNMRNVAYVSVYESKEDSE